MANLLMFLLFKYLLHKHYYKKHAHSIFQIIGIFCNGDTSYTKLQKYIVTFIKGVYLLLF